MNQTTYDRVRLRSETTPYSRYHYQQKPPLSEISTRQSPVASLHQAAATLHQTSTSSLRQADEPRRYSAPSHQAARSARKKPNPVKRQFDLWFIMLAAIIFLVVLAVSLFFLYAEDKPGTSGEAFASTPQSEWAQGTMPTLYQKDTQWANYPYAESDFADSGCGPISLAMVYIYLTGDTSKSPTDIADLATASGRASIDGTDWAFMEEGAATLGMQCEALAADAAVIKAHLEAGNPLIAIMGPGDFTTTGHFIVISGLDHNGQLIIKDSNSKERTKQTWDIDTVLTQCRGLWVYS